LRRRAADFSVERTADAYLQLLGLERPGPPEEAPAQRAPDAGHKVRIAPVLGPLYSTV
jgi:hypothetical protein